MNFIKSYIKSLSVFLLAGFSVLGVYAALSTVSSGDPLTASGWNEIVGKLTSVNTNSDDLVTKSYVDSQVSANGGGVNFAGYTTATYNGDMGGIKGMNQKCNAQYTGSRVCGYDDVVQLGADYPWAENVWIHDGLIGVFNSNTTYNRTFILKNGSTSSSSISATCNGYINNSNNSAYVGSYLDKTSGLQLSSNCSIGLKLACCKG